MNVSENEAVMRKARKDKLVADFRMIVNQLNCIEEKLHAGGLTAKQHDDILIEYRNLSVRITHVESELINDFGINTEQL